MFGNHHCNTSGQLPLLPLFPGAPAVQGSDPQCGHCGYLGRPPGGCPEHSDSSVRRHWAAGDDDPPDWRLLSDRLLDSAENSARDVLKWKWIPAYSWSIKELFVGLGWVGLTS